MDDVQIIALLLILGFFTITFLQSAIDKVVDWSGNLEFLKSHFKNSIFAGQIPAMLATLTLVEFISGISCIYGGARLVYEPTLEPTLFALSICGINLLMLLLGQRMAKDYAGAATIGGYFVLLILGFSFL